MLIARDLARCLEPSLLAYAAGVVLDSWQVDLLTSTSKRLIVLAARQIGKTEAVIWRCIWQALYDPGLVVIASPSLNQSGEFFKRFMERYKALDAAPAITAESALRCELANGARVRCFPGSERSVRGFAAVKLCFVDEAARVDDELFVALKPMLGVTGGTFIMCSTPTGQRGEFYRAWTEGEGWERVKVAADQCPRLTAEFLREQLRELGPQMFKQEFGLEFVSDIEAMFPTAIIERAFTHDVRPLWQ
jgi:Terminase large subunit, T4likevirus-type, N-terminal